MDIYIPVILLTYLCFLPVIFIHFGDANEVQTIQRHKRYLGFSNTSQFFIRMNFKSNIIPWNMLFAQAVGFRMNWNEPPDSFHPHHHLSRRDVFNNLEILLDRNGLHGFYCVQRAICEVNLVPESRGIHLKILKMIFRKQTSTADKWHPYTDNDCQTSINSCPFSVLEISPYTDL